MKVKHILSVFILGLIFTLLGTLFKLLHWQFAPELLITGMLLQVLSGLLAIWKLLTSKNLKNLLNK